MFERLWITDELAKDRLAILGLHASMAARIADGTGLEMDLIMAQKLQEMIDRETEIIQDG